MARRTIGICEECGEEDFLTVRKKGHKLCKNCISASYRKDYAENKQVEDQMVPIYPGYYKTQEQKELVIYFMNLMKWDYLPEHNVFVKPGLKSFNEETGKIEFSFIEKSTKRKRSIHRSQIKDILAHYPLVLQCRALREADVKYSEIARITGKPVQSIMRWARYTEEMIVQLKNYYEETLNTNGKEN